MSLLLFFASLALLALQPTVGAKIHIPSNGTYSVSMSTTKLTDTSRIDPLDPKNGTRSIMTSFFYPIPKTSCKTHCAVPYMPPLTASVFDEAAGFPNGSFASFQLDVCCETDRSYTPDPSTIPLVILSHGLSSSRLIHNAQAQALAASGYAVLSIDHPWDAGIVEFPDEPPIIGTFSDKVLDNSTGTPTPNLEVLTFGVRLRVADISFALDELSKPTTVSQLLPGTNTTFNTTHTAIFGHSYGGATSILSLATDPRIIGALNMDGALYGFDNNTSVITRPAILLGTDVHNSTNDNTWSDAWPRLQGFRREFAIQQAGHQLYTDAPWLLDLWGATLPPELTEPLGELGVKRGKYAFDVILKLTHAFMDFVFEGKKCALLNDPASVFPEVLKVKG